MSLLHLIILSIVQGITEFLPVSSSAHLVLVPFAMEVPDQGLMMDVAVHIGTLLAVIFFFWRELWAMFCGVCGFNCQYSSQIFSKSQSRSLFAYIILATIPVMAVGYVMHMIWPDGIRRMDVIAYASIIFGVLLYVADQYAPKEKEIGDLTWKSALVIGLAQIMALIPGTSRSGVTMTAARSMGFNRRDAARFSLLLGIPTILGAGVLSGYDLYQAGDLMLGLDVLIALLLSFASALVAIYLMMRWLEKASFTIFVIYRILLGVGLLTIIYL